MFLTFPLIEQPFTYFVVSAPSLVQILKCDMRIYHSLSLPNRGSLTNRIYSHRTTVSTPWTYRFG